ncbi:MAG: hypothetical protein Q7W55_01315 [Pseudohongiella sp.]|nr:hypothetical protein [Pseudohongiella sp.]
MCPESNVSLNNPGKREFRIGLQKGVGLPAAIFVITLLSAIAGGISLLVSQNAETFEEEVMLTRAFYAAESGAGLALGVLFPTGSFPEYQARDACSTQPWQYEFSVDGLAQCKAEVSCALDATVDESDYFTLTSVGRCDNISRTVQVRTAYREP